MQETRIGVQHYAFRIVEEAAEGEARSAGAGLADARVGAALLREGTRLGVAVEDRHGVIRGRKHVDVPAVGSDRHRVCVEERHSLRAAIGAGGAYASCRPR